MLEQGSVIDGKYRILSEIGRGGMSIVYLAINEKANKTWAVKEIRRDGKNDYNMVRQSLITEIETLKSVNHPKLPSIIDVIEDEDSFIIVMDYIEGRSMDAILAEKGAQPEEYVKEWAKQLCDVLGYLHSCDPPIIYRDMKPSNIMLKPNGDISIIDFGTAKKYEIALESTTGLGTAGYAAPEQYGGRGRTDVRTDIYALGMTLYSLLTNIDPRRTVIADKSIRKINPNFSRGLDKIIVKCTQDEASLRYHSCAALMYDLNHIDQLDEVYRRKSKIKIGAFAASSLLCVAFAATGWGFRSKAISSATDKYQEYIDLAAASSNYAEKIEFYKESIKIPDKAGEKAAYLGLIDVYLNNDKESLFTDDEAAEIEKLIMANKNEIIKDKERYVEICYEMGKAFWYHYDSSEHLERAKRAYNWFRWVNENSDENYDNHNMALVYEAIGKFYTDIIARIKDGSDKGMYAPLYSNIMSLMDKVVGNENENALIKLELLEMARSAMHEYATGFKIDGITKVQMDELYEQIEKYLEQIEKVQFSDYIDDKRKETESKMTDTKEAIEIAYYTKEGA